jgi:carboxyl-terminal processing protease
MLSLTLDLRTNPGGLLEQGVRVADMFLDRGATLVRTRGRTEDDSHDYVDPAPQRWPNLPLTILVDGRSASAAEIVAGALQDHDRAAIVGSPTYGKGSAQTVFRLSGGGLKLTTARWYTPAGRSITRRDRRETEFGLLLDQGPRDRPRVRTLGGRVVRGGGGIVPDVIAGDTLPNPQEAALNATLGGKAPAFRDALAEVALSVKRAGTVRDAEFTITTPLLDSVYVRLQRRGVEMPRMVFDDASLVVSRLLSYDIARFVFGPEVEFRRRANDDSALLEAVRIARGARSPRDPLRRVAAILERNAQVEPPG